MRRGEKAADSHVYAKHFLLSALLSLFVTQKKSIV